MSHHELLPIDPVIGLGFAQVHQQAVAELADGNRGLPGPMGEQLRRRGIAQQVKHAINHGEGRTAGEKANLLEGMRATGRDPDLLRERKFARPLFEVRREFSHVAVEFERPRGVLGNQFQSRGVTPASEPMQ